MRQLLIFTATFAMLFACSDKKVQVRWVADPSGSYFFPTMDAEAIHKNEGEPLYYGDSVILLEKTGKVIYYKGKALINPSNGDTAYWAKVLWNGIEGYTFINLLSETAPIIEKKPDEIIDNTNTSETNTSETKTENKEYKLRNAQDEIIQLSKEDLIDLLVSSEWTMGHSNIHFESDNTFMAGSQDSYSGKWYMEAGGVISLFEGINSQAPLTVLSFENTYTLVDHYDRSKHPVFYSKEYYENFSISPESQKATEIPLHEIDDNTLIGTWVTEEHGPMGGLFGYKFVQNEFYSGSNSLSDPHGNWDDTHYSFGGNWHYDETGHSITMVYTELKSESADTIKINISKFYNAAFEGTIKSTFYIDEGGDLTRTFYKSRGKAN